MPKPQGSYRPPNLPKPPPRPNKPPPPVGKLPSFEEEEVYCNNCGENEINKLAYLENYANGEEYKCKTCGEKFLWSTGDNC